MKKLLLLLLLIPNLVMAETWVCSYLKNDEIQTSTWKRFSDKEFITDVGFKDRIYEEDGKSIILTHSSGSLGFYLTILDKELKRFITTVTTKNLLKDNDKYTNLHWEGDCKVVK